jgi:hypothetical protein
MAFTMMGSAFAATQFGAKEGSILGGQPGTQSAAGDIIEEEFIDITTLPGDGWALINNSEPLGTSSWFQGNSGVFPSNAGAPSEYIGANFNNCGIGGPEVISNWLITPEVDLGSVGTLSFFTRTVTASSFPDRLQVRLSTAGDSTNVGTTSSDVGDFTTLIDDINPTYALGGYPEDWTEFSYASPGAGSGRIALRYFVESAGPVGVNSNYIGVDSFSLDSGGGDGGGGDGGGVPATSTWGVILLIALFMTVSLFYLRKRGGAKA